MLAVSAFRCTSTAIALGVPVVWLLIGYCSQPSAWECSPPSAETLRARDRFCTVCPLLHRPYRQPKPGSIDAGMDFFQPFYPFQRMRLSQAYAPGFVNYCGRLGRARYNLAAAGAAAPVTRASRRGPWTPVKNTSVRVSRGRSRLG